MYCEYMIRLVDLISAKVVVKLKSRLYTRPRNDRGFSLVELLIVIAILGTLTVAGTANYMSSLEISRDGRRKGDLSSIQKALESYYNDNGFFPTDITADSLCASETNCYLRTIPSDPSGYTYYYVRGNVSGANQSFQLYSTLENEDDTGIGTGTYTDDCGTTCRYGVSSTNTTPDADP